MTDEEGMKILRDWVLNGGDWPSDEFKEWLLPHFTRIFDNFPILEEMRDNRYLPLNEVGIDKDFRKKTAQARRQYVYDCLRFGKAFSLSPEIG